ncbi:MAG: DUF5060 domain-containing protein [Granulosicoccus sp.]
MRLGLCFLLTTACLLPGSLLATTISVAPTQWQPMEIDVAGPTANERDDAPNPFLDFRLNIALTGPDGNQSVVPGFFAGDGVGGGSGNVWRIRFTPDEPGEWSYSVNFKTGTSIAVGDAAGLAVGENGAAGKFTVAVRNPSAPGFLADGRLDYVGEHYLKQADGGFWIKGGIDSPENFFGYAGFDNTINQSGGVNTGKLIDGLHRYAPHIKDWHAGDPDFTSADTGIDGKGIIGAINYLSNEAVNSLYFLPMNLGGDGRETYPFVGAAKTRFDKTHYDVSKLRQWNTVLNHMQRKGIAAHIVLAEQEVPNTEWLDGGNLGLERKLFLRELVARFTYLNAVKWNMSEESRLGADRHRSIADYLRSIDWAAHPIGTHTRKDKPSDTYDALLGNTDIDITSIQFSPNNSEQFVESWRTQSRDAGWPWVIDMDEVGPAQEGLSDTNIDSLRRKVLYPVYFSGGNVEWYFGYHALPLGGDMRTEDFRTRADMYRYMRHARNFMLQNLPFTKMNPADSLLSGGGDGDQVFAKAGDTYAVYLTRANTEPRLKVSDGSYQLAWYDPRKGEFSGKAKIINGSTLDLGKPPAETNQDWVVLVKNTNNTDGIAEGKPSAIIPVNNTGDADVPDTTGSGDSTDSNDRGDGSDQSATATETTPDLASALPDTCKAETLVVPATRHWYTENGVRHDGDNLRIEHNRRTTFLGFDLSSIPAGTQIVSLGFTVAEDRGNGSLTVSAATSVSANDSDNVPIRDRVVATFDSEFTSNNSYRVPLDISVTSGEALTLILDMEANGNDFAINANKELNLEISIEPDCTAGAIASSGREQEQSAEPATGAAVGNNSGGSADYFVVLALAIFGVRRQTMASCVDTEI